ncbi:MAG: GNAT family N-acetyltransferase [Candidatus Moranbacteria bacterium]|nr:GNAT family N-acetyltransferase [Candidatus Moranbacteria bacterium]
MKKHMLILGRSVMVTRAMTRRLAKTYELCFAEYPWCEVFASGEAAAWLREMIRYPENISLGWQSYLGKIVGAAFAFPVSLKSDVVVFVPQSIEVEEVIYIADIFVKRSSRNLGIASKLHEECLNIAKQNGFLYAIGRTNLDSKMRPIFEENGYRIIGTQRVVSRKFMEGKIVSVPDERGIFFRTL